MLANRQKSLGSSRCVRYSKENGPAHLTVLTSIAVSNLCRLKIKFFSRLEYYPATPKLDAHDCCDGELSLSF